MTMPEEWITTAEAAELLKCSERHVRNMAAKGMLKAKKHGKRWLIHSSLSEPETEQIGTNSEQVGTLTEH